MKKMKVNEGEVPQYYVEHSHEAIISPIDWDMVQAEMARRKTLGRAYSGNSIFSSKLVCGDCDGFFGQKVWHSTKNRILSMLEAKGIYIDDDELDNCIESVVAEFNKYKSKEKIPEDPAGAETTDIE